MTVLSTDIKVRLSTTSGAAGNTTAGTPATSTGKYISTTDVGSTLFDTISGAQNAASQVDYRCIFVYNSSAQTLYGAVIYQSAEVAGGATIAIGLDPAAVSAAGASSAQAATIANVLTAPAGVTFSSPGTIGAGLAIGDLAAGQVKAVWVKRTAANTVPVDADGVTFAVAGDTGQ